MTLPVGTRFGRLVTTSSTFLRPRSDGRNRSWVQTECDCGNTKDASVDNLKSGNTTSCGCWHKERAAEANTKHGHRRQAALGNARSKLQNTWRAMKQRCQNPESAQYRWYGGKGVRVYEPWNEFTNFLAWANDSGYAPGLELDRIDSDGHYEPSNCRWVTKKQNIRNRDHGWDDELDRRLIEHAAKVGMNPYEVIRLAVEELLAARPEGGE